MPYMFKLRLTIRGADGDGKPQGHHQDTFDVSEW